MSILLHVLFDLRPISQSFFGLPRSAMSTWVELSTLRLDVIVGINESEQKKLQPVVVEVKLNVPTITAAGDTGNLDLSISYSAVAKQMAFITQHGQWGLLERRHFFGILRSVIG